jgi:hypothetical protein
MTSFKILALGAMALASTSLFACGPAVEKCPTFNVASEVGKDGAGTATFTVSPTRDGLTYNWTASAGSITSGQGTRSAVVTDPTPGNTITATVEVGGLDASCPAGSNTATGSATMP